MRFETGGDLRRPFQFCWLLSPLRLAKTQRSSLSPFMARTIGNLRQADAFARSERGGKTSEPPVGRTVFGWWVRISESMGGPDESVRDGGGSFVWGAGRVWSGWRGAGGQGIVVTRGGARSGAGTRADAEHFTGVATIERFLVEKASSRLSGATVAFEAGRGRRGTVIHWGRH
jgi:hypothetical protein